MKDENNFIRDIAEIRSMMERSSKFLSLSGWAGIMAGIYALAGTYIAFAVLGFNPDKIDYSTNTPEALNSGIAGVIALALLVMILAIGTAILLSVRKAKAKGENVWNASSRRLVANMAVPLSAGGVLIVIMISKGLIGLLAPLSLLFYGLALYNASRVTYDDVKFLGMIQIVLGLVSAWFIQYSLLIWALGFGVVHIIYGIYLYIRYER